MGFSAPPPAPQRGDRTTFSGRVDAFLTWLVALVPQMNAFEGNISAIAAGGANAFSYVFLEGTTNTDPGQGRLAFGGASQAAATTIRISLFTVAGVSIQPLITALLGGTSNIKASIRVQSTTDIAKWLIFDMTGGAIGNGYANLLGSVRISSQTGNLFSGTDSLMAFIEPRGDRGDGGNTPTAQQMRDAIGVLPIANGGTAGTSAATAKANLGLGNVDNTSDLAKPVSTATAAALAQKLSLDGGDVRGPIVLNTNLQLYGRDGGGISRPILNYGGDSNVNFFCGTGGFYNFYNTTLSAIIASLSNDGAFRANTVTETSDERKKTNWRPLTDAQLDALAEMELVGIFDWIDGSGSAVGASAQQIRAIVPWAVHEDAEGNLSVAYGGLAFAMAHGALLRSRRAAV